jgi:hypothetical protein
MLLNDYMKKILNIYFKLVNMSLTPNSHLKKILSAIEKYFGFNEEFKFERNRKYLDVVDISPDVDFLELLKEIGIFTQKETEKIDPSFQILNYKKIIEIRKITEPHFEENENILRNWIDENKVIGILYHFNNNSLQENMEEICKKDYKFSLTSREYSSPIELFCKNNLRFAHQIEKDSIFQNSTFLSPLDCKEVKKDKNFFHSLHENRYVLKTTNNKLSESLSLFLFATEKHSGEFEGIDLNDFSYKIKRDIIIYNLKQINMTYGENNSKFPIRIFQEGESYYPIFEICSSLSPKTNSFYVLIQDKKNFAEIKESLIWEKKKKNTDDFKLIINEDNELSETKQNKLINSPSQSLSLNDNSTTQISETKHNKFPKSSSQPIKTSVVIKSSSQPASVIKSSSQPIKTTSVIKSSSQPIKTTSVIKSSSQPSSKKRANKSNKTNKNKKQKDLFFSVPSQQQISNDFTLSDEFKTYTKTFNVLDCLFSNIKEIYSGQLTFIGKNWIQNEAKFYYNDQEIEKKDIDILMGPEKWLGSNVSNYFFKIFLLIFI